MKNQDQKTHHLYVLLTYKTTLPSIYLELRHVRDNANIC